MNPLQELLQFPLMQALFGRRSRRFGLGMEIPTGPLAFKSRHAPIPLSELEQAVPMAAATGVTGWNFGIPYTPHREREFAHYAERFTGRSAPTSAGIGTPVLFHTDDRGVFLMNLRDALSAAERSNLEPMAVVRDFGAALTPASDKL